MENVGRILKAAWRKYRSWPMWAQIVGGVVAVAIVVGPFTGADDNKETSETADAESTQPDEQDKTSTTREPETSTTKAECLDASVVASAIEEGLTVSGEGSISKAAALPVANPGFFSYVVAGEIDGSGMEGDGEVGIWAVAKLDGGGTIIAVNGLAREFSVWGSDARDGSSLAERRDEVGNSRQAEDVKDCL